MNRWVIYRKSSGTIIRIVLAENQPDISGDVSFLLVPSGIKFSTKEKIDSLKARIQYEPIGSEVRYRRSEEIVWKEI